MGLFFCIPPSIRRNHAVWRPILLPIRAIIRNNCPTSLKLSVPTSVNTKKRDWRKMFRYRTLSHNRQIGIPYLCIVIQKARKITCPVGEKNLPNWENKKVMKTRLQASKRVVSQSTSSKRNLRKEEKAKLSRGQKKNMNQNMKAFIRYLIVAICSAIVTFLSSSCTAGLVIGKNQRQHQENNISTKVDSTYYVPTITIR